MKKIMIFASALIFAASVTVFGQTSKPAASATTLSVKQEQAKPASTNTMHSSATTNQKTKTMISANELPKAAQDYITKTYPGKKIDKAEKFTDANGTVKYKAQVGEINLHFDSNGKFMNESIKEAKPATQAAPAPENKKPAEPAKK